MKCFSYPSIEIQIEWHKDLAYHKQIGFFHVGESKLFVSNVVYKQLRNENINRVWCQFQLFFPSLRSKLPSLLFILARLVFPYEILFVLQYSVWGVFAFLLSLSFFFLSLSVLRLFPIWLVDWLRSWFRRGTDNKQVTANGTEPAGLLGYQPVVH